MALPMRKKEDPMNLPYRTRRALRRLGIALLWLVLAAVLLWLVWLFWLDRYVVYSRDGAQLDFKLTSENLSGQVAAPPEAGETVSIYYNEGENALDTSTDLSQIYGFYVDSNAMEDMDAVKAQIEALPAGTPVMLDVKSIYGYFFYSSSLGPQSDDISISAVDELIAYLKSKNIYAIARVPAFRDYYYGLNHDTNGLPHIDGGYLWQDEKNCYWLNPDSSGTINYLVQIALELKELGFKEVVFSEFRFPDTDSILYEGNKAEALNTAAQKLVSSCATTTFAVSFCVDKGTLTLPEGRSRLYLQNVTAFDVESAAEQSGLADPTVQLVFVTEAKDTRFDAYGVLRPLASANS